MSVILTVICSASTGAVRDTAFPRDESLDAQGLAKASALAGSIRRVDTAWSSPARRAVETAVALGIDAAIAPALRDIDYGAWSGHTLEEVASADPTGVQSWLGDSTAAPHGGESVVACFDRVGAWLERVGAGDGRVIAVAHPAIARIAIVQALNAPINSFWRIDVGPLARVRLRAGAGRWTLVSLQPS